MKLYTRTGDDGSTGLFDGSRVPKDHPRCAACGDVDELNAWLGLAVAAATAEPAAGLLRPRLLQIQSELFEIGGDLATPVEAGNRQRVPTVSAAHVTRLEHWIDNASDRVPPLKNFVLPNGAELACRLHAARAVARRAERSIVTLSRGESLNPDILRYVNRLSDLLFAWARLANHAAGIEETPWIPTVRA